MKCRMYAQDRKKGALPVTGGWPSDRQLVSHSRKASLPLGQESRWKRKVREINSEPQWRTDTSQVQTDIYPSGKELPSSFWSNLIWLAAVGGRFLGECSVCDSPLRHPKPTQSSASLRRVLLYGAGTSATNVHVWSRRGNVQFA